MIFNIEGLQPLHFVLAYAGMLLHILMKLAECINKPDFVFQSFLKTNIIPIIISVIGIPVLLIVATDTTIQGFLPINNVTAVLAGWQTQSLFKTLVSLRGKKEEKEETDTTDPK